eukprot:8838920-Ditylum_brightwellii.AAC.1
MAQSTKARKVDDSMDVEKSNASKSAASHDNKVVRFFTGTYKGRIGRVNSTICASAGCVPVLVDIGSGVMEKAIVSV